LFFLGCTTGAIGRRRLKAPQRRYGTRRRFSWGSGDWVRPAALLCEKCSYFRLRRVPEGVLAISCTGGAGRIGEPCMMASKYSLTTGRHASCARFDAGEGSMSFHVVRHEHSTIFVVNRQTYETYRFTIGDDVALARVGPPSDLGEARRTAIAFLAQRERENPPR
jgi:hypothetical protein